VKTVARVVSSKTQKVKNNIIVETSEKKNKQNGLKVKKGLKLAQKIGAIARNPWYH
jgi:hypothetical protein